MKKVVAFIGFLIVLTSSIKLYAKADVNSVLWQSILAKLGYYDKAITGETSDPNFKNGARLFLRDHSQVTGQKSGHSNNVELFELLVQASKACILPETGTHNNIRNNRKYCYSLASRQSRNNVNQLKEENADLKNKIVAALKQCNPVLAAYKPTKMHWLGMKFVVQRNRIMDWKRAYPYISQKVLEKIKSERVCNRLKSRITWNTNLLKIYREIYDIYDKVAFKYKPKEFSYIKYTPQAARFLNRK